MKTGHRSATFMPLHRSRFKSRSKKDEPQRVRTAKRRKRRAPSRLVSFFLTVLLTTLCASPEDSQTTPASPAGIWKWTFTMPDGSQITPRLEIKEKEGKLSGSTRFRAGTDTPVTNLMVNGNQVSF